MSERAKGNARDNGSQSVPWVEEDQRCVSSSSRPLTTAAASRLRAGRPSEWARARSRMRARCQRSWHSEHAVGSVAAVLIPTAGAASAVHGGRKAEEVRGVKRAAGCTLVATAAAAAAAARPVSHAGSSAAAGAAVAAAAAAAAAAARRRSACNPRTQSRASSSVCAARCRSSPDASSRVRQRHGGGRGGGSAWRHCTHCAWLRP